MAMKRCAAAASVSADAEVVLVVEALVNALLLCMHRSQSRHLLMMMRVLCCADVMTGHCRRRMSLAGGVLHVISLSHKLWRE